MQAKYPYTQLLLFAFMYEDEGLWAEDAEAHEALRLPLVRPCGLQSDWERWERPSALCQPLRALNVTQSEF